jgi:hypothetical protein
MINFRHLLSCFGGKTKTTIEDSIHESPKIPETLQYEDDISLLFFASKEQKV